ncbi:MAG TPA: M14 family zinc carboxypeptidase [Actinomycetota bacterium]|nr:M14 family zinc carboxypeptidase [Actinomycetota bacterium]
MAKVEPSGMRRLPILCLLVVSVMTFVVPASQGAPDGIGLALVEARSVRDRAIVAASFDETHRYLPHAVEIVMWPGDVARLDVMEFDYTITVDDLVARDRAATGIGGTGAARLPGPDRTTYRTLTDYHDEMRALASAHPSIARTFELPYKTLEGRAVMGLEIAADVTRADGRPTFHVDGLHHAREWPSGEYPMIFAHHLVEGFGTDPRITSLLRGVRVTVVPVVNPDGFDFSRSSVVDPPTATYPFELLGVESYWRKNRHSLTGLTLPGLQRSPDAYGVDPNRNYAYMWGDDLGGSSESEVGQDHRGEEAFSESESRNIRALVLSRQVTGMVSNHSYGRLVLRPWAHTSDPAPDEELLERLGGKLAASMGGYENITGIGLYIATGTAIDWAYAATGALTFTFEHGEAFHPPYADSVGTQWPGVVEAFLTTAEAAADAANHGVLSGQVLDRDGRPVRAEITVSKSFETASWDGATFDERIKSGATTDGNGSFELHLNPSTRPVVPADAAPESYRVTFVAEGWTRSFSVVVGRGGRIDLGGFRLTDSS